jgi:hypothetical protein
MSNRIAGRALIYLLTLFVIAHPEKINIMKMFFINSFFAITCVLLLLSSGCRKEAFQAKQYGRQIENRTFDLFLPEELARKNWDGSISISNRKPFGSEPAITNSEGTDIYATFLNDLHSSRVSEGELVIDNGEIILTPDDSHIYRTGKAGYNAVKRLFGNEISIEMDGANQQPPVLFSENLKIPDPIFITSPIIENSLTTTLGRNFEVSWNADSENNKGVFIAVTFDSQSPWNPLFKETESVAKVLHVEDSGYYSLTSTDFSGIPAGARVELWVGRGNFVETTDASTQQKAYIIYCYTVAFGRFVLQ